MSVLKQSKNHIKTVISCTALSALLVLQSMSAGAVNVSAAANGQSVINPNRSGTLVIHKMIDNDGTLQNADGIANFGDYIPVDNVGFDYVKIAGFENVSGIIVSKDGNIQPGSAKGNVSVGNYFRADDSLKDLFEAAGEIPDSCFRYVK